MTKGIDFSVRMRRTTRVPIRVAVRISTKDAFGSPEMFTAWSVVVNKHGARFSCKRSFEVGKEVGITCLATGKSSAGKVVWTTESEDSQGNFEFAIELFEPVNIWQIAFPPSDWLENGRSVSESDFLSESMKDLMGEIAGTHAPKPSESRTVEIPSAELEDDRNETAPQSHEGPVAASGIGMTAAPERIVQKVENVPALFGNSKGPEPPVSGALPALAFPAVEIPPIPLHSAQPAASSQPLSFVPELKQIEQLAHPSPNTEALISASSEERASERAVERHPGIPAAGEPVSESPVPGEYEELFSLPKLSSLRARDESKDEAVPRHAFANAPESAPAAPQPAPEPLPGGRMTEALRLTNMLREFTQSAIQTNIQSDAEKIVEMVKKSLAAEQEKLLYNLLDHSQTLLASQDAAVEARVAESKKILDATAAAALQSIQKGFTEQAASAAGQVQKALLQELLQEVDKTRAESIEKVRKSAGDQAARAAALVEESVRSLRTQIEEARSAVSSNIESFRAEIKTQIAQAAEKMDERERAMSSTANELEQRLARRLEESRSHLEAQMAEAAKAMVGGLTMHLLKSLNKTQQEYLQQAQHQFAMVSEQGLSDVRSGIARSLREVADALGIKLQKPGSE